MILIPRRLLHYVHALNRRLLDVSYRLDLPFALGGPSSLMVEPIAACNLRCPLCPTGIRVTKRDGYTLDPEDFERALGWFRYTIQTVTFWNWGEPFMNRRSCPDGRDRVPERHADGDLDERPLPRPADAR